MTNDLLNSIDKYRRNHELPEACQLAMQQTYPRLLLRWARIYGSRWAYLTGNSANTLCLQPARYIISSEYGIFIDNADVLSPSELEDIVQTLKGCFADAKTQS